MWSHNYIPVNGSLVLSSLVAALPVFVLLFLIGIKRKPAWMAAISGLGGALVIALFVYQMPADLAVRSVAMGAAFGLWPIGWIVYSAIVLYMIVLGLGSGLTGPTLTISAQNASRPGELGVVTALLQFARSMGNTLGTAAVVIVAAATFRRRPLGNTLIVLGVAIAAAGTAVAGLGVAGTAGFALAAVLVLYAGFVAPSR